MSKLSNILRTPSREIKNIPLKRALPKRGMKARVNVISLGGRKIEYPSKYGGMIPRPAVNMPGSSGKRVRLISLGEYPKIGGSGKG